MNFHDVLNQFEFIRQLPASERERAAGAAQLAKLANRAHFYRQGQTIDQLGLVATGSIRVFRIGENGREITLYHVNAGETCLVNLLSVLLARDACASAQAEGTVTAALLPGDMVRTWVRSSETFRRYAFDNMGHRLIDVMTLVEEVAFRKMDRRLAEHLHRRGAADPRIVTTHEEIAAELGTAREVVSRLLNTFAQQGAIALARGCIRVKRPDTLLAIAQDTL
ncbi:MAG: Crp/Fnr family transcriptional regulator [Verrucomicrobiales bacterium]|nr:Crp/Fnr family transcriptional regulator [Verrucomicrobiales bacterium]